LGDFYEVSKFEVLRELPYPEGYGFLLPRPDSVSIHPERSLPTVETFLRATSGRMGYGGLDLHRRKFGLSHAYVRKYIERKESFGFHP
jgi:hypothetical protein